VKATAEEGRTAGVPEGAKQAEEARADWVRADPGVWTERMLNALQYGVKGGKWSTLA